jgi:hypothetical protein
MDYPRFVFISPGKNTCNGGTYGHEVVQDAKEHKAALEAGYSDSVPEALAAMDVVKESIEAEDKPAARRGRPPKESQDA